MADVVSQLRSLVDSVQDDPSAVRAVAIAALDDNDTSDVLAHAHWALGLAARELHDLDEADRCLRLAVEAARDGGMPGLEGEILISQALVLAYRGDVDAGLSALDRADLVLEGAAAARSLKQRGLILTRMGRLDEALEAYGRALPVIRAGRDETAEVRLLLNRSVVYMWQGADRAAIDDLEVALSIARRRGQSLQVAACAQNLGFVRGRLGEVPAALELFAEAEAEYRRLGDESGRVAVVLKDRAEVLAEVGLVEDALADVTDAVQMLELAGNVLDAAEARLTAARLAAVADDPYRSLDDASVAGRAFEDQHRQDWALLADLVAYAATVDLGQGTLDHGTRLALDLERRGWLLEAQEARLSAAKAAIREGDTTGGLALLELAGSAASSAIQRVQAHQARAVALATTRDAGGARAEVRRGLEELDRHRATLGSIELRARVAARARDLIQLGLQLAVDGGDAIDVLSTIESWRAASMRFPPVRPPDDEALADDMARIRSLDAEVRQAQSIGASVEELIRRRAEIEGRVRRRSLASHGSGAEGPQALVDEAIGALGDRRVIAFFVDRGRLGAVTVDGDRASLIDLDDAERVAGSTRSLVFMLHRMAGGVGSEASLAAAAAAFEDEVRELGRLLIPAGDRDQALLVIPTGGLHRLPWQAIAPGRCLSVVPSLGSWHEALRRWRPADSESTALLVAGPDVPAGADEVRELSRRWPHHRTLSGSDATVGAVLAAFEPGDVAHIAAHGQFRSDNPLFSSIRLADGPLTVYDLERVLAMPSTVIVPSCDMAVSEVARADELLGFTAALLALGVTGVVAPVVPISDEATTPLMMALHERIRAGDPVGPALATALDSIERASLAEHAVAASFVAFGV